MQYRKLGKTNLQVSSIGFGTWGFANDPDAWIGATKEESEKALLTALDEGVNFIDTARVYGNGLAETWLGEILQKVTHKDIIVASKMYPKNQEWSGMKGVSIQEAFPKTHIIELVDQSLRALKRESIDVMYFHVWEDEWAQEEEWRETITQITEMGKVRYWGISTNDYEPTNCITACQTGLISVVMTIFNLFYQTPITTLFPFAKKMDIGLVARVPLDEGGLTGSFNAQTRFPDGDFRQTYFSPSRLVELETHLKKLTPFVDGQEIKSLSELALKFILSFEEVASAVPGMRQSKHVQANTSVAEASPLPSSVVKELVAHAWNRNFYEDEF